MSTPATRSGLAYAPQAAAAAPKQPVSTNYAGTVATQDARERERQAAAEAARREAQDSQAAATGGLPGGVPGRAGNPELGAGTGGASAAAGPSVTPGPPNMWWDREAYINIAKPDNYWLGGNQAYVQNAAAAANQIANNAAAQQAGIGGIQLDLANRSAISGAQAAGRLDAAGRELGAYGQGAANQLNAQARSTTTMGDYAFNQGAEAARRGGPVADFGQQTAALGQSQSAVDQLLALEASQGPSAAQAQLQAGLNAAADSNTSLSRSGRGWGQSASALAQAGRQNAVMGANVANQAAILRAQEDAAARQRAASNIATGAGINQAAASQFGAQAQANVQNALQATQINDAARQGLYNTGLQAQQVAGSQQAAAGQLGLSGLQSGATAMGQAGQLQLAGDAQASQMAQAAAQNYATGAGQQQNALTFGSQLAQTQLQASQAYEQARLQEYGIRKGVAIQNNNQMMQLIGGGIAAAGTAAAVLSDVRAKDRIKPVSAVDSLLTGEEEDAAERYAGPDRDQMDQHMRSGAETQAKSKQKNKALGALGGGMQAFGSLMGDDESPGLDMVNQYTPGGGVFMSDEREKTNLRPARGYSYEYKDPARHGQGRFYGPMAQDLLKTPAGRSSVVRQPDGSLGVDTGRLSLTNTSAIGEQQRRTDDVDARVSALERLLSDDAEEQRGRRTAENSHRPKGRAA